MSAIYAVGIDLGTTNSVVAYTRLDQDEKRIELLPIPQIVAAATVEAPPAKQKVVLTVPASFDASARELTRQAALAAGLPENLVLIEEPQAALYAWLADAGERWRRQLHEGDTLLVCDIGGGTTDFSLI